ncbi:hypothetical protein WBK31_38870 [Nonomuraea sp. N2-4H]|jgi:hypothetical protein|uniref:hypothetical protein n=1 Tax=Nonomuraea sp. N2-4H TaxID=3128898 RepID=UPI003255CED2
MTKQDIDDVVSRFAAPAVTSVSEGARDLMHQIIATSPAPAPAKSRKRLGLRVALPAGALLAAGAVAATAWVFPAQPASALSIKQEGGYYVIEIKDLYANPKVYEQELRRVGLDITLRVRPATAAYERLIRPVRPDYTYIKEIKSILPPGPCHNQSGCAVGVKIPKDFSGTATIDVFRQAQPGEKYESITEFNAKGEPMHCVRYLNKRVSDVLAMLKERGVRVNEYFDSTLVGRDDGTARLESVPGDWHVDGGALTEPGVAFLSVSKDPMPQEKITFLNEKSLRAYGCPIV